MRIRWFKIVLSRLLCSIIFRHNYWQIPSRSERYNYKNTIMTHSLFQLIKHLSKVLAKSKETAPEQSQGNITTIRSYYITLPYSGYSQQTIFELHHKKRNIRISWKWKSKQGSWSAETYCQTLQIVVHDWWRQGSKGCFIDATISLTQWNAAKNTTFNCHQASGNDPITHWRSQYFRQTLGR